MKHLAILLCTLTAHLLAVNPIHLIKPPHHDMANHVFEAGSYSYHGQYLGELKYINDVPVIFCYSREPYYQGRTISYFTKEGHRKFQKTYIKWLRRFIRLRFGFVKTNPINYVVKQAEKLDFAMPDHIASEVSGLLDEYNEHEPRRCLGKRLTTLQADHQMKLTAATDVFKGFGICSSTLKRVGDSVEVYRNLDWGTMGILGTYSFCVVRPLEQSDTEKPQATISFAIPPGHAGITTVNDKGLVVVLHEAAKFKTNRNLEGGYPEAFLNRLIVENCTTVEEALDFIDAHPPASTHSVVLRDAHGNGTIVQMLPTDQEELYTQRPLSPTSSFNVVTNHHLDSAGEPIEGSIAASDSIDRFQRMVTAAVSEKSGEEILQSVVKGDTLHSLIFFEGESGLEVKLVFDNTEAACGEYRHLELTPLFEQVLNFHLAEN